MSTLFYFLTLFAQDLFSWKNVPFGILVGICVWFGFAEVFGSRRQMAWAAAVGMVGAIGAVGFGVWKAGW